jgi:sigma-B regulation protein RsbU (phosphoserine phosphatase)
MDDFPAGRFVTMVYAVLDPATRTLTFANAGHPWPLLVQDARTELLGTDSGLPLGVTVGDYQERVVPMTPGAGVLLYSDGITEACNAQDEEFGTARLEKLARRPKISVEQMLNEVRWFSGARGIADDATLILIADVRR